MKGYNIVRADPAGNITIFVLAEIADAAERARIARVIMEDKTLGAEQVGFCVIPSGGGSAEIPRLTMMGGEFCGNAARSFALLVAKERGIKGKAAFVVSVSGAKNPVKCSVDTETDSAECELDAPLRLPLSTEDAAFYEFQGITHVIVPETDKKAEKFNETRLILEKYCADNGKKAPDALGAMFWDAQKRFMTPLVYVRGTDTLIFESSCGSGTAALGAYLAENAQNGQFSTPITQKGGVITVSVEKKNGKIARLSIGGRVTLEEMGAVKD